MVGARCLWENLVGGATQKKKKEIVDAPLIKKNELEVKAKEKSKDEARKALYTKLK